MRENPGKQHSAKSKEPSQRTDWAELELERLLSVPFIAESVYRSPKTISGGIEKEVADMLISQASASILASQKCQQDPASRDSTKAASWARKQAKEAVKQLIGALRTGHTKEIWCEHPRRGRVAFKSGLLHILVKMAGESRRKMATDSR